MTRPRWPALLAIGVISALLAFFLRDVIYQDVIVPVAYILWVLNLYYSAIPQAIQWAVLVAALFLVGLWNLLPEIRFPANKVHPHPQPEGQVEALANWIRKSRHGNYFKWQIANRLGRIARRMEEASGPQGRDASLDPEVESYLDAGLNYSFVDFPSRRHRFERLPRTALDVDPGRVADFLESQMEHHSDWRG